MKVGDDFEFGVGMLCIVGIIEVELDIGGDLLMFLFILLVNCVDVEGMGLFGLGSCINYWLMFVGLVD